MNTNYLKTVSILIVFLFLFTACATTNQQGSAKGGGGGSTSDQNRTRAEGAVIGALLGTALGVALGGDSKAQGALIGAAIGAGTGYLVGNEVAKRKRKYANEEAFLNAEIKSAREFNDTAQEYNKTLRHQVALLDSASMQLKAKYNAGFVSKKDLKNKRNEVQKKLVRSNKFHNALKKEYDIKLAVYNEQQKKRSKNDVYLVNLRKEITELRSNLDQLDIESKQLASIDERLTI